MKSHKTICGVFAGILQLTVCSLTLFAADPALEDALQCKKKFKIEKVFSDGGRIRVDQIFLCVTKEGRATGLHYRASAMDNSRFVGNSNTPWIHLRVYDRNNRTLFEDKTLQLAEVDRCGGNQGHWKLIPLGEKLDDVHSFEIFVGKTGLKRLTACDVRKRTSFDRIVWDVKKNVSRYLKGEFTEEERRIIALAKAAMGSGQ